MLSLTLGSAFGSYAADSDYVENLDFSKTVTIAFSDTSVVNGVEYILSGAASSGYVRIQDVAAAERNLCPARGRLCPTETVYGGCRP